MRSRSRFTPSTARVSPTGYEMTWVRADNIMVEFPIYGARSRSLKNTVIRAATGGVIAREAGEGVVVRAIDNVSFSWKEGDRVGLMGHNGAGKTTLLRVVAGIYEPIGGTLSIHGRVVSMLSIAVGMEPEATGYENIFLRGTILGMNKREIGALVDHVREFSELGDYIDMPLRTYSSGMSMRLAFAISTSVTADIIVMDEWLAVGDEQFAKKAQQRLQEMVGKAKILVMASHSQDVIAANCNKLMRLDHGRVVSESGMEALVRT